MATSVAPKPTNKRGVPHHVYAVKLLLCSNCAQLVLPTLTRLANGLVTEVNYYHVNEEVGCAWKLLGEVDYARQEGVGLQEYVRAGNDEHGKPKYINEKDLAVGKSFDVDGLKPKTYFVGVDMAAAGEYGVTAPDPETGRVPPLRTFAKAAEAIKQRIKETEAAEAQPPAEQPAQNAQESGTGDGA